MYVQPSNGKEPAKIVFTAEDREEIEKIGYSAYYTQTYMNHSSEKKLKEG